MSNGIKFVAIHPMDRTYIFELGNHYADTGAAEFLKLKAASFLIRQGYNNTDTNTPYNIDFNIVGNNFHYSSGVPTSGTVTGINIDVNGDRAYEFSKLNVSIPTLANFYSGNDPFAAFAALLVGDDKIIGSQFNDHDVFGGRGNDILWGRRGDDRLNGGKGSDVNDGGLGNDFLADTQGHDTFQFSTKFKVSGNLHYNFDTIKSFGSGDEIYLKYDIFGVYNGHTTIGHTLGAGEFHKGGTAQDANDYILWAKHQNTIYYDPDANGPMDPIPIFKTLNDAHFTYMSFAVGLDGY